MMKADPRIVNIIGFCRFTVITAFKFLDNVAGHIDTVLSLVTQRSWS